MPPLGIFFEVFFSLFFCPKRIKIGFRGLLKNRHCQKSAPHWELAKYMRPHRRLAKIKWPPSKSPALPAHNGAKFCFYVPPGINKEAPLKTDLLLIYIFQVLCVSTPMVKNEAEIFECGPKRKKNDKKIPKILLGLRKKFEAL